MTKKFEVRTSGGAGQVERITQLVRLAGGILSRIEAIEFNTTSLAVIVGEVKAASASEEEAIVGAIEAMGVAAEAPAPQKTATHALTWTQDPKTTIKAFTVHESTSLASYMAGELGMNLLLVRVQPTTAVVARESAQGTRIVRIEACEGEMVMQDASQHESESLARMLASYFVPYGYKVQLTRLRDRATFEFGASTQKRDAA